MRIVDYRPQPVGEVVLFGLEEAGRVTAASPTVIQVEVPVASLIHPDLKVGIYGVIDAKLVTVIKDRVFRTRAKSHPGRTPKRREARVRRPIVMRRSSRKHKAEHVATRAI